MFPISVCIPVYNRAKCIGECIESILRQTFTDFELLIVDDGSTDETCDVILSYDDPRIRLIRGEHDYIGSCNRLFDEAKGKYIARMDSDDLMLPDRLRIQYEYMESHPEVDILGGGAIFFNEEDDAETIYNKLPHEIGIKELQQHTFIVHPTAMMRRESIMRHKLCYDANYIYAEDYHFWFQAVKAGLHIHHIEDLLIRYRYSKQQVTYLHNTKQEENSQRIVNEINRWISRDEEAWAVAHPITIPKSKNKLTLIIPFLNEGEEVVNTVRSVREHVGNRVDIMVINDQSFDGYDYRSDLVPYDVIYIYNVERKGVAGSRDYGVALCRTPYFLLLDAHMRVYNGDWLDDIIAILDENDRRLLCMQTKILHKEKDGTVTGNDAPNTSKTFGAYLPFYKNNILPDIKWNSKERNPSADIEIIPVVLGAGYAASKRYWQYLRGLEELISYGCDESYISLKVWLEGGECLLLKRHFFGHIYREFSPYNVYNNETIFNCLLISSLLFPSLYRTWNNAIACVTAPKEYLFAIKRLDERGEELLSLKAYYDSIFTVPFDKVLDLHRFCKQDLYDELDTRKTILNDVFKHITGTPICDYGIAYGKAGAVIWLMHYERFTSTDTSAYWGTLLDEVDNAVLSGRLPTNFGYGLCGIGWMYLYLMLQGFLYEYNDKIIKHIDKSVQSINLCRLTDDDFYTGLGGILCYIVTRLRQTCETLGGNTIFGETFLDEAYSAAQQAVKRGKNVYTCFFAFQLIDIVDNRNTNPSEWIPKVKDWLDYPYALPNDKNYWGNGLREGCWGYTLPSMIEI